MKDSATKEKLILLLKEQFLKEGLIATLESATKEVPFDHIKLNLGLNRQNHPVFIYMWLFSSPKSQSEKSNREGLFLQVFIPFHFHYTDQTLLSTARFILMLNKVIAFPGFGLSEPERGLYFKYTLCFPNGKLNQELISDFLGSVQFMCDAHLPNIELIASGESSLEGIRI